MAQSTIKLYKTKITPGKNARVAQIEDYLAGCDTIITTANYFKHNLNATLKLTLEQTYSFGAGGYNYLSITNDDDDKKVYYFIMDSNWLSQSAVQFTLAMDSINSFFNEFVWSKNTKITRQHKDRFVQKQIPSRGTSVKLVRKVDKEAEGINPVKLYRTDSKQKVYQDSLATLSDTNAKKANWYLIYRASQSLTTTNLDNPIECYCTSDYSFKLQDLPTGLQYTDYPSGTCIALTAADNSSIGTIAIKIGSRQYYLSGDNAGFIFTFESNLIRVRVVGVGDTFTTTTRFYILNGSYQPLTVPVKARVLSPATTTTDTLSFLNYVMSHTQRYIEIKQQGATGTMATIDTVDRTDSRNMKIIELPYAPFTPSFTSSEQITTPDGWTISQGMFKLQDLNTEFFNDLAFIDVEDINYDFSNTEATFEKQPINQQLESKLYNSEFYDFNVRYDSFTKSYQLEHLNAYNTYDSLTSVEFKPTNTINSNFLFRFSHANDAYKEIDINGEYLNAKRNNELPMYSSDYVNYIRNGYNYDRKANQRQLSQSLFNAGITGAFTALSRIAGGAFGGAVAIQIGLSAAQQAISGVQSAVNAEQSLKQKLNELKNSPASVNGADDIDLLNFTTGNKLETYKNSCTPTMQAALSNLFRLTGYACNETGIPNWNTRWYYDYIQCTPEFVNEQNVELTEDVIADFKARFEAGITVYHKRGTFWDLDQQYENYENWIVVR